MDSDPNCLVPIYLKEKNQLSKIWPNLNNWTTARQKISLMTEICSRSSMKSSQVKKKTPLEPIQ